jgi:hypothetical protein
VLSSNTCVSNVAATPSIGRPSWSKPGVRVLSFATNAPFASKRPDGAGAPRRHARNAS